jgi:1-deoxy-D-xylulose-5-phosphate reductoisomerase
MDTPSKRLDLGEIGSLEFEAPDPERFPALRLAREALKAGGSMATVLNASNEIAVAAFLSEKIGFLDIVSVVEDSMSRIDYGPLSTIDDVFYLDGVARKTASELVSKQYTRS